MKPVSPVLPGRHFHEMHFAAHQSEYITLPALVSADTNGIVTSRWKFSFWERIRLLVRGSLYVQTLTLGHTLQPLKLSVQAPTPEECGVAEPRFEPVGDADIHEFSTLP